MSRDGRMKSIKKILPIILISALIVVVATSLVTSASANSTTNLMNAKPYNEEPSRQKLGIGYAHHRHHDFNRLFKIYVSEEFKKKVVEISRSDSEVSSLFDKDYRVESIKPIIKATIKEDGSVILRASEAYLILVKENVGFAIIKVDLEVGKVVEKQIFEKPNREQ
ncbi:MAG: hypothetical protein N3G77_06025 [Nitrososphaeria archaeon]|nr:hypothetical protein [Nitrososphaeria archaeon]MDW7985876.1 hypothetical protein [Nitrososphaerota archaeon]